MAGCNAIVSKYIGISRPYIYISAEGGTVACGPVSKNFFANSSDSITAYNWSFGDGTSSSLSQPAHLFSVPGSYSVTLAYTTITGCKGTVSYGNLTVYSKPVANFNASATTVCGNVPVTFLAVDQGLGVYYSWYFGDNLSDYSFNTSTSHTSMALIVITR